MGKIFTRFGDGSPTELSEAELLRELEEGTKDASDRGEVPPLSKEELQHLFEIFALPHRFIGVEPGKEVVLSYDGTPIKMMRAQVISGYCQEGGIISTVPWSMLSTESPCFSTRLDIL